MTNEVDLSQRAQIRSLLASRSFNAILNRPTPKRTNVPAGESIIWCLIFRIGLLIGPHKLYAILQFIYTKQLWMTTHNRQIVYEWTFAYRMLRDKHNNDLYLHWAVNNFARKKMLLRLGVIE